MPAIITAMWAADVARHPRPRNVPDAVSILLPDDEIECTVTHVYPMFGRPHLVDGEACWCDPDHESSGDDWLVIHNAEN